MKLNPQQAPLYGDCVVTVLLAEEDKVEDDVVFYLVFSGSSLHHYTSTRKVNPDTLETIAPGHDCCETVKVLLCASKEGLPVFVVAEEDFRFIQDEVYDAAQFLATSAGNQQALNFTRFLDRSGPPTGDVNSLDEKVALAFRHLKLPAEWNVLGTDQTLNEGGPRETLMHFAVRLGLLRLTWFLLQKPGGRGALNIHNEEGATPASLALERGYQKLHQLLTQENAEEPDSWSSLSYEIPYGDCSVRHHRELDVYTLTSESESDDESLFSRDSRTGHIFKLMSIQHQLMSIQSSEPAVKPTDDLASSSVIAQDPPNAAEEDEPGHPFSSALLKLPQSSPPAGDMACPGRPGSEVGQAAGSEDSASLVGPNPQRPSATPEDAKVERVEGEPEASSPGSDEGGPGQRPPSRTPGEESRTQLGITNEETGISPPIITLPQRCLSQGDPAAQEKNSTEPTNSVPIVADLTAPVLPFPETAGEREGKDPASPPATGAERESEESIAQGLRTSDDSSGENPRLEMETEPLEANRTPNRAPALSPLGSKMPEEDPAKRELEETAVRGTGTGTETPRGRGPRSHVSGTEEVEKKEKEEEKEGTVGQCPGVGSAPAKNDTLTGFQRASRSVGQVESDSPTAQELAIPGKLAPSQQEIALPIAAGENDQSVASTIRSIIEDDILGMISFCLQGTTPPPGEKAGEPSGSTASGPEDSSEPQESSQSSPAPKGNLGPETHRGAPDPGGDPQEGADCFSSGFLLKDPVEGATLSAGPDQVALPSEPTLPETGEEPAPSGMEALEGPSPQDPGEVLAGSSGTKANALLFGDSQAGTGCSQGGPAQLTEEPDKVPEPGHPTDRPGCLSPPPPPQPEPGPANLITAGVLGDRRGLCPPPSPEAACDLPLAGLEPDAPSMSNGETSLPPEWAPSGVGNEPVTSENIWAQGGGREVRGVDSPIMKDIALGLAPQPAEGETPPPRQEAAEPSHQPASASAAESKTPLGTESVGTPSAFPAVELKQNKEVAANVSGVADESSTTQGQVALETALPADRQMHLGSVAGESGLLVAVHQAETSPAVAGHKALDDERAPAMEAAVGDGGLEGEPPAWAGSGCKTTDVRGGTEVTPLVLEGEERHDGLEDAPKLDALEERKVGVDPGQPGPVSYGGSLVLTQATIPAPVNVCCEEKCLGETEEAFPVKEADGEATTPRVSLQPIAEEPPCNGDCTGDPGARQGESPPGVREAEEVMPPAIADGASLGEKSLPEPPQLPSSQSAEGTGPVGEMAAQTVLEAVASRLVEAVIEGAKTADALLSAVLERGSPTLSEPGSGTDKAKMTSTAAEEMVNSPQPREAQGTEQVLNGVTAASLEVNPTVKEDEGKDSPGVQGPETAADMPDMKAEDEVDFQNNSRESSVSEETEIGNVAKHKMKRGMEAQKVSSIDKPEINQESWCRIEPSPTTPVLAITKAPGCIRCLKDGPGEGYIPSPGSNAELSRPLSGLDNDLTKSPEEQVTCRLLMEDPVAVKEPPSLGVSIPEVQDLSDQQSPGRTNDHDDGAEGKDTETMGSGETGEEMDSLTDVSENCSNLRNSLRSLSPFRRHSWGPGKNSASDAEMNSRSSVRVLGDVLRRPPIHRRSMSWCPSGVQYPTVLGADFNCRSFSLEGLAGGVDSNKSSSALEATSTSPKQQRCSPLSSEERTSSLVSLTEEDLDSNQQQHRMFERQPRQRSKQPGFGYCTSAISSPLTKSISLMTISHPGLDNSRPFHNTSANLTESISEETYNFPPHSPSKKDFEGKSGTKVSRTFSYIKNKMSSGKKSKEKEKEKDKTKEKDKDTKEKEKDKKTLNGHSFSSMPVVGPINCYQCAKPFTNKDSYTCANCSVFVHRGCRESLASCAKVKMKQPKGNLQAHDTSSLPTVIMRNKPSQPKERPRSAILVPDETTMVPLFNSRRSQQSSALSKSISIQNIAGVGNDESMSTTWKFLSHSTDSLNKISKVNESTESLTDEGTDMNEGQLMGDFEMESKQLEAESWSQVVDTKFLNQQHKDMVKRQEVIYELLQTELHHIRTLKIMSDVYSRGMMTDLLFEQQMVEKLFPCLDELLKIHSQFFQRILERKKESLVDRSEKNFLITRIGDVLVHQFSGENAERLKKTYGKFCGQHNQSVNYFKDLHNKDKRFQAFVKKKMSTAIVRRLGIPECILLVTQRITKYPVLFQRILQYTSQNDAEGRDLTQALALVKDVIGAVDSKVANYEKKLRLNEIYLKTDSKSIMRMKTGQMFAKEDLKRKKLVRDGTLSLKNSSGRLKEVQAVLLTDLLVFLQEKDQKYVFASLDQKATVISLKKLIVREVAHEEKALFLISMGMKDPEMVEVHASSKEERNGWIRVVQDTINAVNSDEDEGIPSESEEEKKILDPRTRELKDQIQQKDQQILNLLEEKKMIFRDLTDCSAHLSDDASPTPDSRVLFRASTKEAPKGAPIIKSAMNEVQVLQDLVKGNLGNVLGQPVNNLSEQEGVGPISLPRRAETFGGFDSHQMNASKGGEKEEGDECQDLRRTESDSGLKKGGNSNLVFVMKRNSERVIQSIVHLHELLNTLQGVVLQQDSYIEDQKLMLNERVMSRSLSRPNSLIEQEKQRSLEKQRQDLANLQKQQSQHLEEKRKREKEWEARERELAEREAQLVQGEEQMQRDQQELDREREELRQKKGAYQIDLERLRASQKQLEKDQEQLRKDNERLLQKQSEFEANQMSQHNRLMRIPSFFPNPEEPSGPSAPPPAWQGSLDSELTVSPPKNSISRTHKDRGPFHLLSGTGQSGKAPEGSGQSPPSASTRLFGLAKPKEKKEKKKKSKGSRSQPPDSLSSEAPAEGEEIFC
ncbi:A-kinase anchor protein 13 isoform X2 [Tachyglossus aculeatus]|uniref:A-kinase anchor protein 13 isoform X2 n=1 Tax=Tachyglossus aculeatus TaxID=9261 RepID=UPI0018F72E64|nr:A-kinase anchor protein 13 isoform X2 [Tachyglossus aculeatus]